MKLKLIAAAALLVSAGAYADTTFDLGTVGGTLPIGNTVAAGSFTDTYNFSVASLSGVSAIALNTSYSSDAFSLGNIGFFAASLDGVPLTLSIATSDLGGGVTMMIQTLETSAPLPMTSLVTHTLTIAGIADAPTAAYTGELTVSPVPEPQTYAMMLAGLGAMGWLARRRKA